MSRKLHLIRGSLEGLAWAGTKVAPPSHDNVVMPKIVNGTTSDQLFLYGDIGASWFGEGITAQSVSNALTDAKSTSLDVYLNSNGGDVFQGIAIHTLLARHPATVTVYIDGIAASAASFIAQAGDHVVAARNAMVMIHKASTMTWGNVDDHQETLDLLDKIDSNIADFYTERAGDSVEEWLARMAATTWYTGQEAMDAGLVDEVNEPPSGTEDEVTDRVRNGLGRWRSVPADITARYAPKLEPIQNTNDPQPVDDAVGDDDFAFRMAMALTHAGISGGRK